MFIRIIKKNYFFVFILFLIIILNLFLLTLPLTKVFGYEFSAVNALLLSFFSGLVSISHLKKTQKEKIGVDKTFLLKKLFLLLCIPFLISIVNSLFTGFCSFSDGLLFYLVITLPSVIIGAAIGSVIFLFIKKFRYVFFILVYILILLIPVLEIYFNPQVYLYNPLFAYFPGTIYDEGISVDLKLFIYRIFNLLFFLPLLLYSMKKLSSPSLKISLKMFLIPIIIFAALFYFILSPMFGFTTTESKLNSHIIAKIESEHFIISADEGVDRKNLEQFTLNCEYYFEQLKDFFKDEPDKKISVYLFIDRTQKKDLFGSENADVSKPWLNSIYISFDSWEVTLKHELAHCFSAEFGTGIFKLSGGYSPSLIESVAEAADGFYDENDILFVASLAYKNDYKVDLNTLFSSFGFFTNVSGLSYIYAGSFVSYLISEYGIEKVKIYYATNDFYNSFGINFNNAASEFENYIDTLNTDLSQENANYYFGLKPLISKVCPRFISSSLMKAWGHYYNKDFSKAECIFEDIISKVENFSALIGLSKIYEEIDSLSKAVILLEKSLNTFSGTSNEYEMKLRLADLYVKNSESDKAVELYKFIMDTKPSRRLQLLAETRFLLLTQGILESYLSGSEYDKYSILKKINSGYYIYSSIPFMIELSNSLDESYKSFLDNFKNNFEVNDEVSSYAAFKISEYMLKNTDYLNARKMVGLSLRFKGNQNLFNLVNEHFKKTEWFNKNAGNVLSRTKFELN